MKATKGFSLIEMLVVVALVGILAAVAIPQYTQYILRGNRAAAQAFMTDIASREKQYLLDARNYTSDFTTTSGLAMAEPADVSKYYTITVCVDVNGAACSTPSSPPYFKITGKPIVGTSQAADGNLTLDDSDAKTYGTANNW